MGSTLLGSCIRFFLKNLVSNFRLHIRYSKWGRKWVFINCTSCNGSLQQIPFQFANGKLPYSSCRAFWAGLKYIKSKKWLQIDFKNFSITSNSQSINVHDCDFCFSFMCTWHTLPRMLCNGNGVISHLQTEMGFVEDFCYSLYNW